MHNEKSIKIRCLITTLLSTNIWIFMWFQLDMTKANCKTLFYSTFLFPITLQLIAILLASTAFKSSTKQVTRTGSVIALIYSILSFILFFLISAIIMTACP